MKTPALEILQQKKEALLPELGVGAATGGALVGAGHGLIRGMAGVRPPTATGMFTDLGAQVRGIPHTIGGGLRGLGVGAIRGAIAPFTWLGKGLVQGAAGHAPVAGAGPAAAAPPVAAPRLSDNAALSPQMRAHLKALGH